MTVWDSSIAFTMQVQGQDQWCWAAAAASISLYYDPDNSPWSQCTLAEAIVPDAQNCCPKNPACNKQQPLDVALSQTQNFSLEAPGPITIDQINGELSNRRAVAARMDFSGTGHFVVISAVSIADQMLRVCDPQYGTTTAGYNEFSNHYLGKGTWSSSLLTITHLNPAMAAVIEPATVPSEILNLFTPSRRAPDTSSLGLRKQRPRAAAESALHEVVVPDLRDLAEASWSRTAPATGWRRVVVTADGDAYAVEAASAAALVDEKSVTVNRGPYVSQTVHALYDVRSQLRNDGIPRTLYLVRAPSIHVVALWLKANSDDESILVPMAPAPEPLQAGKSYRIAEVNPILSGLANRQLTANAVTLTR